MEEIKDLGYGDFCTERTRRDARTGCSFGELLVAGSRN